MHAAGATFPVVAGFPGPAILNAPFTNVATYAASLNGLLANLKVSETLPPAQLAELQSQRLQSLLSGAATQSPYWQAVFKTHGINLVGENPFAELQKLPLLTRRTLQTEQQGMVAATLHPSHQPIAFTQTSGSSGEPVRVLRTALTERFWHAFTMREHAWHGRDFSQNLAIFRATLPTSSTATFPSWGPPVAYLHTTGKAYAMLINSPVSEQAAWLGQNNAAYLTVYPSNLAALLTELETQAIQLPHLKQVRTIGETLPPQLRDRVTSQLHVPVVDVYSSQELGTIAIQCPQSDAGLYHVMAEALVVEVLDENGQACSPGQSGRVVVTDLTNYGMPLIRYALGDYAVQGGACSCGRTLPTLGRILGRERNMAVRNGQRFWPLVGFAKFRQAAPIRQYQVIQYAEDALEMRLVPERPLTEAEEAALRTILTTALDIPATVSFTYFEDKIPAGKNGKFEEFICLA